MKKSHYIAPSITCYQLNTDSLMQTNSITGITGNSGITTNPGTAPTKGDSRDGYSIWSDGEEEQQ